MSGNALVEDRTIGIPMAPRPFVSREGEPIRTESLPPELFVVRPNDNRASDDHEGAPRPIEGIPRTHIDTYIEVACRHASVREIEPGSWFAGIDGLTGTWGTGNTESEALDDLEDSLMAWIALKLRDGDEIPVVEGLDINRVRISGQAT